MDIALFPRWLRYNALFRPLSYLPRPLAYRSATLVGRYDYYHSRHHHAAFSAGMKKALPQATPEQLRQWTRQYFAMLARESMDVFCMPGVKPGDGRKFARLRDGSLDILHEARQHGRGVIIAMSHFSRLNMLLLALALAGEKLGMLTIVTDERNPDLNPVERVYINRKIKNLMAFIGGPWITVEDNLRLLYDAMKNNNTLVILFDAFIPGRGQRQRRLPFLGGHLTVSSGIERLAQKTGARILYGVSRENGWNTEAELKPLPDDPLAAIDRAAFYLEQDIRATPWQWWQWNALDYIWTPDDGELA